MAYMIGESDKYLAQSSGKFEALTGMANWDPT
jgi:hypothetical protein